MQKIRLDDFMGFFFFNLIICEKTVLHTHTHWNCQAHEIIAIQFNSKQHSSTSWGWGMRAQTNTCYLSHWCVRFLHPAQDPARVSAWEQKTNSAGTDLWAALPPQLHPWWSKALGGEWEIEFLPSSAQADTKRNIKRRPTCRACNQTQK